MTFSRALQMDCDTEVWLRIAESTRSPRLVEMREIAIRRWRDSVLSGAPLIPGQIDTNGQVFTADRSFSAVLPRFNVLYRLNDDFNVFATASKGRRSPVVQLSAARAGGDGLRRGRLRHRRHRRGGEVLRLRAGGPLRQARVARVLRERSRAARCRAGQRAGCPASSQRAAAGGGGGRSRTASRESNPRSLSGPRTGVDSM